MPRGELQGSRLKELTGRGVQAGAGPCRKACGVHHFETNKQRGKKDLLLFPHALIHLYLVWCLVLVCYPATDETLDV